MKLPNGFGSVYKLSGNRRNPYVAKKTMRTCKTSSEKTSVECLTQCRLQKRTEK